MIINESLNLEIWDRLIQGRSLDGLALGTKDGRVDVGGLELPEPSIVRRFQVHGVPMAEIDPGAVIHGAKWRNFDFSGSKLNGLRLFGCELSSCRFDRCQLQDFRVWSTTFTECSFKGANLKKSALGGVQNGKRNIYFGVDFSDADLSGTVYKAAAFERCVFRSAKLVKIDFQTSTFADCVFEGELRDVLFYRRGFEGEAFPPNEMVNVDFSRAKLHDVGFRGLTLDRVKLPQDDNHIVIRNVPATLDKLIAALKQQGDILAKQLTAFLNIDRKWVVPNQAQAVINVQDLAETLGDAGVNRLRELLRQ
jgi:uncharacterized protein YjbI with pentapeptide repeats